MATKKCKPLIRTAFFSVLFSLITLCSHSSPFNISSAASSRTSDLSLPYPIGVFEDAGILSGNEQKFQAMIADLNAHALDSVMFTNNFAYRDSALLTISDDLGFNVYMLPSGDLNETWWPPEIPADKHTALQVAKPIVDLWKSHSSFKGYITKDEPGLHELEKVKLIQQAFQELDPFHPAMPILIGVDRVGPIFLATLPQVMLIDVYPVGVNNPECDFTMTGFGYTTYDFVGYIRAVIQSKPPSTPLWVILQTHSFQDQLREPTQTEVREQHWLAIGEGAKGIFWFIYSSQQGWKGLVDNPTLYAEVTSLARRTNPLRDILQELQKVENQFLVSGTGNWRPYISTLRSSDNRSFVVAVNRDCLNEQNLTISSPTLEGGLKDLETSAIYSLDTPILFPAGDGKILELVPESAVHFIYLPYIE